MNLTAITDPEEIVIKHFLDSLLLLAPFLPKKEVFSVCRCRNQVPDFLEFQL